MIWNIVFVVHGVGALVVSQYREMCPLTGQKGLEEMEQHADKAYVCINNLVDIDVAHQEYLAAKPTGSFTSLAKKYCPKASKLKDCIKQLYIEPDPCLPSFHLNNLIAVHNVSKLAIDFICLNDGENVNSFAAEGGLQCLSDKIEMLDRCGIDMHNAPSDNSPSSHEVHCRIISGVENCAISTLQNCPTAAAVNLAKPLLAVARKAHSCP